MNFIIHENVTKFRKKKNRSLGKTQNAWQEITNILI